MDKRWEEIERIYHAAQELDIGARAGFLAKACAGDEVLRREVESLLTQAEQAGSFLESPAIEVAAEAYAKEEPLSDPPKPALAIGAMVAHYRLAGKIGEGGMGEVYRASDTRLQRDVALKILPSAMAHDADRMARFEREAQVLASLNHPNIAAIYGLEESNGIRALAMELVEGETLAEHIAVAAWPSPRARSGEFTLPRGGVKPPLQISQALPIAKQIAEALEYAHEHGVIHRDLKPANVKITPESTVKVLDFGLAKVLNPQDSTTALDPANSPTLSAMATEAGMILGTASYMSPEQAKGQKVDRRCDIWAYGCVLYEMLSGRKAFEGETISDVLAAVLKSEPDWNSMPSTTPPSIQRLIRRCLQKDLRQRLQAIGDARIAIEETISGVGEASALPTGSPARREPKGLPYRALPLAIGGFLICLAAFAGWRLGTRNAGPAPQRSPVLSYIPPPPNTTFRDLGFGAGPVVVSQDGAELAFSATDENGKTELYVRPLASDKAQAIAGTDDAAGPFWSPDGRSLGFFAAEKLKTVNLNNGNVQILADASCTTLNGAWSLSGMILYTPRCDGPLEEIPASGGNPKPATPPTDNEWVNDPPAFLPDGRRFLFMSSRNGPPSIWMGSLDSSEEKLVLKGAGSPGFASGYLLFTRDNRVFAQPFDPAAAKLSGEALVLAEAQSYSASDNGVLAFQGGTPQARLEWFDRSGNALGNVGPVEVYDAAKISPDGRRILANIDGPQRDSSDLWSFPAAGGLGTRLTFTPGFKFFSVWSPDGKDIAYSCFPGGKPGICLKASDGSGAEKVLFTFGAGIGITLVVGWSPDGRYLSYIEWVNKDSRFSSWVAPLFGDRKPFQVAAVSADQYEGSFSPDGHWLAYFSYETGRPEVYVVPFPGPGGKYQISQNGGWILRWDRKGHLYFLTMGDRLMEADLETSGKSLQVKAIHPLFQLTLPSDVGSFFDVNADGSRFLVITSTDPNASRSIGLLLDWESKLKGR